MFLRTRGTRFGSSGFAFLGISTGVLNAALFDPRTRRLSKIGVINGILHSDRPDFCVSPGFRRILYARGEFKNSGTRMLFNPVLSLLWWKDERMLIALDEHEERQASRRSDDR
jgi:hypothetical protein